MTHHSKVFPCDSTCECYVVDVAVDGLLLAEEFGLAVVDVAAGLSMCVVVGIWRGRGEGIPLCDCDVAENGCVDLMEDG